MAFVIPYRGCKIKLTTGIWEGPKEFASYEVNGSNPATKRALGLKPIKGRTTADKALDTAKHQIDQLLGKAK
nr:hypothetical protein [uncultured Dongia sp.]